MRNDRLSHVRVCRYRGFERADVLIVACAGRFDAQLRSRRPSRLGEREQQSLSREGRQVLRQHEERPVRVSVGRGERRLPSVALRLVEVGLSIEQLERLDPSAQRLERPEASLPLVRIRIAHTGRVVRACCFSLGRPNLEAPPPQTRLVEFIARALGDVRALQQRAPAEALLRAATDSGEVRPSRPLLRN